MFGCIPHSTYFCLRPFKQIPFASSSALHPSPIFQIAWRLRQRKEDRSLSNVNRLPFTSVQIYFGWGHKRLQRERADCKICQAIAITDEEGWVGLGMWKVGSERRSLGCAGGSAARRASTIYVSSRGIQRPSRASWSKDQINVRANFILSYICASHEKSLHHHRKLDSNCPSWWNQRRC